MSAPAQKGEAAGKTGMDETVIEKTTDDSFCMLGTPR